MPAAKPPEFRQRAVNLRSSERSRLRRSREISGSPSRVWSSRDELAAAIFEWIECFYNTQRRHSSVEMLSPIDYETTHAA
jgi:transposase InsO family protein